MSSVRTILVPVDLEAPSRRALAAAAELAQRFGAELVLVHVFDVPMSYAGMDLPPQVLFAPIWDAQRRELDTALAEVQKTVPNSRLVLTQGVPWREVLSTIEQARPDLVVMGTRGRRGLARALLGSVAEKIVRLSPAPVLTMHENDEP